MQVAQRLQRRLQPSELQTQRGVASDAHAVFVLASTHATRHSLRAQNRLRAAQRPYLVCRWTSRGWRRCGECEHRLLLEGGLSQRAASQRVPHALQRREAHKRHVVVNVSRLRAFSARSLHGLIVHRSCGSTVKSEAHQSRLFQGANAPSGGSSWSAACMVPARGALNWWTTWHASEHPSPTPFVQP